jgi:hypothetical protein
MILTLRWRAPQRQIATRWHGPDGMLQAVTRDPAMPVAAIIGPPGPPGPAGLQGPAGPSVSPARIEASLAATWVLANPLGRIPTVHVFLSSGEPVLTDVQTDNAQITVTFPSPQQGFVLAF